MLGIYLTMGLGLYYGCAKGRAGAWIKVRSSAAGPPVLEESGVLHRALSA